MSSVLWVTAEALRAIAIMAQPFIPQAAARLLDLLAVPADGRSLDGVDAAHALVAGTALPAPAAIFPRYVEPEAGDADR